MRYLLILFFLTSCSYHFPASLKADLSNPERVSCSGDDLLLFFETDSNSYTVVGIHPAFGRDFILQVAEGVVVREEYGRFCSKRRVSKIIGSYALSK